MGMFDEIKCKYPLPIPGMQDRTYQTKDTPAQYLDLYEIREDGTFWHHEYDYRNDGRKHNYRWVQEPMTGEIRFYDFPTGDYKDGGWVEFSAYFVDGKLREINTIINKSPIQSEAQET